MSRREDLFDFEYNFYRIPLCAHIQNENLQNKLNEFLKYYNDERDVFGSDKCRYNWYTDHGLSHVRNIWCIANRLYSINPYLKKSNDEEIFIFCHAIWLHDIGMSSALTHIPKYEKELLDFLNLFSNRPLTSIEYDDSSLIRDHHSIIARFFIENDEAHKMLPIICDYPKDFRQKIGLLCHYHQSSHIINSAQVIKENKLYFKKSNLSDEIIKYKFDNNMIFFATLLRFLDECDNTNKRLIDEIKDSVNRHYTEEEIVKLWMNIDSNLTSEKVKKIWGECKYSSLDNVPQINKNLLKFKEFSEINNSISLNKLLTEYFSKIKAIDEYESKKTFDDVFFTPNRIILPKSSINLKNRQQYENRMKKNLYNELQNCSLILKQLNKKIIELISLDSDSIIVIDPKNEEKYEVQLLNPEFLFIEKLLDTKIKCDNYSEYLSLIKEFIQKNLFSEPPDIKEIFRKIINEKPFFSEVINHPEIFDRLTNILIENDQNMALFCKELLKNLADEKSKFIVDNWFSLNPVVIEKNSNNINQIAILEQKIRQSSVGEDFNLRKNYDDYKNKFKEFKHFFQGKNWKNSIILGKYIENNYPATDSQWKLYYDIGRCYYELGKKDNEAIEYFIKSIKLREMENDSYIFLGMIFHRRLENSKKAILWFERGLENNSSVTIDTLRSLGNCYINNHQYNKAIELLVKAVENNPYCRECINDLARAYGKNRDFAKGIAHLDKIISSFGRDISDPKSKNALAACYDNKGYILNEQKKYKEAIICFKNSIDLNNNYASAWKNFIFACLFCDVVDNRDTFIRAPVVFLDSLDHITDPEQQRKIVSSKFVKSFFAKAIYYGIIESMDQLEMALKEFKSKFNPILESHHLDSIAITIPNIKQECNGNRLYEYLNEIKKVFPDIDLKNDADLSQEL